MHRVLITGGSGFIGTNLVEHYRLRGDQVVNIDAKAPQHPEHGPLWKKIDVLDRAGLLRAVVEFDPELVYHMAARTDLNGKTADDYSINTRGVVNVIEAFRALRRLRLAIFASSMLVCRIGYGPKDEFDYCPSTAYGESKVEGEQLMRKNAANALPWIIVRPTSIWGPWFGPPYRDFFTMVQRGLYFHPKARAIRRSYGFVLNTVFQLDRLAAAEGGALLGRAVYLADYEPLELKHWADTIQRALDVRPVRQVPLWAMRSAARIGDLLKLFGVAAPISSFRLNNMLTEMIHDISPLARACGTTPYTMEEGVRLTCDWLRRYSK